MKIITFFKNFFKNFLPNFNPKIIVNNNGSTTINYSPRVLMYRDGSVSLYLNSNLSVYKQIPLKKYIKNTIEIKSNIISYIISKKIPKYYIIYLIIRTILTLLSIILMLLTSLPIFVILTDFLLYFNEDLSPEYYEYIVNHGLNNKLYINESVHTELSSSSQEVLSPTEVDLGSLQNLSINSNRSSIIPNSTSGTHRSWAEVLDSNNNVVRRSVIFSESTQMWVEESVEGSTRSLILPTLSSSERSSRSSSWNTINDITLLEIENIMNQAGVLNNTDEQSYYIYQNFDESLANSINSYRNNLNVPYNSDISSFGVIGSNTDVELANNNSINRIVNESLGLFNRPIRTSLSNLSTLDTFPSTNSNYWNQEIIEENSINSSIEFGNQRMIERNSIIRCILDLDKYYLKTHVYLSNLERTGELCVNNHNIIGLNRILGEELLWINIKPNQLDQVSLRDVDPRWINFTFNIHNPIAIIYEPTVLQYQIFSTHLDNYNNIIEHNIFLTKQLSDFRVYHNNTVYPIKELWPSEGLYVSFENTSWSKVSHLCDNCESQGQITSTNNWLNKFRPKLFSKTVINELRSVFYKK